MLEALRERARPVLASAPLASYRRLADHTETLRLAAGAGVLLALGHLLPRALLLLPLCAVLFWLADRLDRAAALPIPDDVPRGAEAGREMLRLGRGLLEPPGTEDLALLQTPSGDAWADGGIGHSRLGQAALLAKADAVLWSAHLADMAADAGTAAWPAALLRHRGRLFGFITQKKGGSA